MDKVFMLLQGLKPEFEGNCSQLDNRENSLSFDVQLLSEQSRLQEMKGGGDSSAYSVTNQEGSSSTSSHQVLPPNSNSGGLRLILY